jgi:hypothetical protein
MRSIRESPRSAALIPWRQDAVCLFKLTYKLSFKLLYFIDRVFDPRKFEICAGRYQCFDAETRGIVIAWMEILADTPLQSREIRRLAEVHKI